MLSSFMTLSAGFGLYSEWAKLILSPWWGFFSCHHLQSAMHVLALKKRSEVVFLEVTTVAYAHQTPGLFSG